MAKHTDYHSPTYHVQASRTYQKKHCKWIGMSVIYIVSNFWSVNCIKLAMFHYRNSDYLQDKIALNITIEQGKTLKDAYNEVLRGLGWCFYYFPSSMKSFYELVWLSFSSSLIFLLSFRGVGARLWNGRFANGGVCLKYTKWNWYVQHKRASWGLCWYLFFQLSSNDPIMGKPAVFVVLHLFWFSLSSFTSNWK